MLDIIAICLVVTALLAYVNHRFLRLPTTIGVMVTALGLSLAIVGLDALGVAHGLRVAEEHLVNSINFSEVLLQGMLSLLLFAGAMHVDLRKLKAFRNQIISLAVLSTATSTLLIGFAMWKLLPLCGVELALPFCLLFGALISPTDPVAVMGILKSAGAPEGLKVVITGESLFNDGVGVVLFSLLLTMASTGVTPSVQTGLAAFILEAGGGLLFGGVVGYLTYRLLKSVDHYQVEVLMTLASVIGGYALANHLHVSGPLAMVVAGVMIGNRGRADAMSETTRRYVDMFWELIDEILNAVLFVLIGMEVLLVEFPGRILLAGAGAALVALLARLVSVGLPVMLLGRASRLPRGAWSVLTWGGLRGGISVALALSIQPGPGRDIVLALTYCVVVSSILGQGLTVGWIIRRAAGVKEE
ncbi:sodium:proton antiporter [Paraburkholderia sp. MM5384-R2]|uniref:cation:proton antiporter n=1 Tax=Paraburkholderia sp. MM5384-R2 TaxID=2723097 RepID=UPI00160EC91E|nr:sodium:proton antiporter [Paraburkholderia sp. MM5384-R2]MBB5496452.1 CPA1 family monovalent cation:H+ antiporter [Paraburkholderia sp. MM5384-R2]